MIPSVPTANENWVGESFSLLWNSYNRYTLEDNFPIMWGKLTLHFDERVKLLSGRTCYRMIILGGGVEFWGNYHTPSIKETFFSNLGEKSKSQEKRNQQVSDCSTATSMKFWERRIMFSRDAIQLLKQKSDILKYDCICNSQSSFGKTDS